MNVHPQHHPSYYKTQSLLRTSRSKETAVSRLSDEDKIPLNDAYELVEYAFNRNISNGRKNASLYLIGGAVVSAIFISVLVFTGRLYYIILPIALYAFIKGAYEFATTNGFDG